MRLQNTKYISNKTIWYHCVLRPHQFRQSIRLFQTEESFFAFSLTNESFRIMSDSDDDLPIAELIKKRKKIEAAKVAAAVKKTAVEKPKAPAASSNNASTKSTSAPRSSSQSSSGNKAADFYTETLKGQLVQSFLVRWWYAMEWPKMEEIGEPPAGYESLDGFPGVFISTRVSLLQSLCMDAHSNKNISSFLRPYRLILSGKY